MLFTQLQNSLCVVALYRPCQLLLQIWPGTARCGTEGFYQEPKKDIHIKATG